MLLPVTNSVSRREQALALWNVGEQQANRLTDETNRSSQDKQSVKCPNLHKLVSFLSETVQQQFRFKYEQNAHFSIIVLQK